MATGFNRRVSDTFYLSRIIGGGRRRGGYNGGMGDVGMTGRRRWGAVAAGAALAALAAAMIFLSSAPGGAALAALAVMPTIAPYVAAAVEMGWLPVIFWGGVVVLVFALGLVVGGWRAESSSPPPTQKSPASLATTKSKVAAAESDYPLPVILPAEKEKSAAATR